MREVNFKHTEIGPIPHDWEVKMLGEVGYLQNGFAYNSRTFGDMGYTVIRISDIKDGKIVLDDAIKSITKAPDAFIVKKGNFLIAMSGATTGKIGLYFNEFPSYINQRVGNIICVEADSGFVRYSFNSICFAEYLKTIITAGAQPNISKKQIEEFAFATPPTLAEQEKIANALSKIDQLINDLGALIEKKKAIKQGTMQDLLTAKRRLKGFTGEWNSVKLGDLLEYRQPTKYLVASKEYTTQGVPVLTAGKTFILGYTQENWGLYDDLPVIIFDDFVVESKYVTMPFKVKSSAIKMLSLREKENDLRFIFEKMQCIEFPIADHKRHWISEYSQLEITIPEPNEQRAIANILSSMDTEIINLEQKRDKYIAIKQGMMQNLLTGKIRLI